MDLWCADCVFFELDGQLEGQLEGHFSACSDTENPVF